MIFAWDEINRDHIARHQVSPEEAQEIVVGACTPFPMEIDDEKLTVWGQTDEGRYLQVIFVLKPPHEVSYESLSIADWMVVESGEIVDVVRVIHAMDLTPSMKKRFRRRRR